MLCKSKFLFLSLLQVSLGKGEGHGCHHQQEDTSLGGDPGGQQVQFSDSFSEDIKPNFLSTNFISSCYQFKRIGFLGFLSSS